MVVWACNRLVYVRDRGKSRLAAFNDGCKTVQKVNPGVQRRPKPTPHRINQPLPETTGLSKGTEIAVSGLQR
jgi:hypothetical protein